MIKPDQLLRLVTHLQNEQSLLTAQRLLLHYIRKSSGAQLVALFTYNQETQRLELQTYSGRRRNQHVQSAGSRGTNLTRRLDIKHIRTDGLFGSVLNTQGFVQITQPYNDQRILQEERQWTNATGCLLLSALRANNLSDSPQSVLILSFEQSEDASTTRYPAQLANEGEILICTILLSAYLDNTQEKIVAIGEPQRSFFERTPSGRLSPLHLESDLSSITLTGLDSLSELYELGLAAGTQLEQQELYQRILLHIARTMYSPGASLLRLQPDQRTFSVVATLGQPIHEQDLLMMLNVTALERLATYGPGKNYIDIPLDDECVRIITLSCNCTLLGVIALLQDEEVLAPEREVLLTYLGNVAAQLLHNYDTQQAEKKLLLDRERNRIACDMHDGVAQHIAHALHKIEYVQRLFERQQPQNQPVQTELQRAYNQLENGLYKLRQCIASLRPLELEKQNFADALNTLLEEYKASYPEVEVISDVHGLGQLPLNLETPIFLFIQEAFNNLYKHAHATRAILRIHTFSGLLTIEVQDNGSGIQPAQSQEAGATNGQHMGMHTMKERIHEAGGYWEIHSKPGEGTLVKARFALQGAVTTLTNRERDILRLLVEGLTNRAIAEKLSISQDTVKSHIHHIIQKMRVRDRTQAAVMATRQGWL